MPEQIDTQLPSYQEYSIEDWLGNKSGIRSIFTALHNVSQWNLRGKEVPLVKVTTELSMVESLTSDSLSFCFLHPPRCTMFRFPVNERGCKRACAIIDSAARARDRAKNQTRTYVRVCVHVRVYARHLRCTIKFFHSHIWT